LAGAAFVCALSGDVGEALSLTTEFEAATRGKPVSRLPNLVTAVGVAVAADAIDLAQTVLDGCAPVMPSLAGDTSLATAGALIAEARGQRVEAADLYRQALAGWREWGSVVQEGYSLLGLGRAGDDDARRDGMAIFERLRAVPFTSAVRAA
jgi:hypothetical protein